MVFATLVEMDRQLFQHALALTERRIAEVEKHIERQREVLANLSDAERDETETFRVAVQVMDGLQYTFERLVRQRKWIGAELSLCDRAPRSRRRPG